MRPTGKPRSLWLIALVLTACSTTSVPSTELSGDGPIAGAEVTSTAPVTTTVPEVTSTAPVTTTVPESISTSLEVPADSGVLDTPLGTFSWRHVTGDRSSLPYPEGGGLVATTSGFAAIGYEWDRDSGEPVGFQYWRSLDGYQWTLEPMPVPLQPETARLLQLQDESWLITLNPETLWRSVDGETWSGIPIPPGASLQWDSLLEANGIWLMGSRLWRLDGSQWIEIDSNPPWAAFGNQANLRTIMAADDRFLAFVETEGPDGAAILRFWASRNASEWEGPATPDNIAGRFAGDHIYRSISSYGGVLVAEFEYGGSTHVFVSSQGRAWSEALAQNKGQLRPLILLDSGGIYIDEAAQAMWVSADLQNWEGGDEGLGMGSLVMGALPKGGDRGLEAYGLGEVIFFVSSDEQSGMREMWILELQE